VDINYIANVHDRVGNVHDFMVLFRAMSTNPVDNVHDLVILFRATFTNPVDNIHDFVVLFRAMSTSFWFSSVLYQAKWIRQKLV